MADINIGQFSEALNDKMDRDSNNANQAVAKQSDLTTLQNTVSTLQSAVTTLQGEMSKMLGRIDYSNGSSVSFPYTCSSDGYIMFLSYNVSSASGDRTFYINDKEIFVAEATSAQYNLLGTLIPVSAGDVISFGNKISSVSAMFYPQKS